MRLKKLLKIKVMLRSCFVLCTLYFVLSTSSSHAQQDAQFSQYMFNPFVLNPAYAGCRETFTALVVNRNQWISIPGAPNTQTLSLNTPVTRRVGVGLQVFNDMIGPRNTTGYLASYSYRIPLEVGKLAFGIRAGGLTYLINWDKIEYKDQGDFYNMYNRTVSTYFNSDAGVFYNTRTFYTGFSINHLGYTRDIAPIRIHGIENQLQMHGFYTIGNTFELNDQLALQPSLLLKFTPAAPLNADFNMNLLIDQKIWLGLSYRTSSALVFLTQFYVNDNFRFGYSYDHGLQNIGRLSRGSHELYLGFDLKIKHTRSLSPRYF
jgi:type IX secretion system PorP/SprF family membrane protein